MSESGIGAQTLVLLIQHEPTAFDTSPEALIELRKHGVPDEVLNAMIAVVSSVPKTTAKGDESSCLTLMNRALTAVGPLEKLSSVNAIRIEGSSIETTQSGTHSFKFERVVRFPDTMYLKTESSEGVERKLVITPDFNYSTSGKMTSAVPSTNIENLRAFVKADPLYVAQHLQSYTCVLEGVEQIQTTGTYRLKLIGAGRDVRWNVDAETGHLLRIRVGGSGGDEHLIEYSDWRSVDGISVAFRRHTIDGNRTSDVVMSRYEVNPVLEPNLFTPPHDRPSAALTFRVLQSESVPYVVQTSNGVSTNCQISGSTATSTSSISAGALSTQTSSTTPNLTMNCNSSENTFAWQHVLNAMLIEASDGNAYVIGCDRAWRWSRCTWLRPGAPFNARWTEKGLQVQFFDVKGHEKEAIYRVLSTKSLR